MEPQGNAHKFHKQLVPVVPQFNMGSFMFDDEFPALRPVLLLVNENKPKQGEGGALLRCENKCISLPFETLRTPIF